MISREEYTIYKMVKKKQLPIWHWALLNDKAHAVTTKSAYDNEDLKFI